MEIGQDKIEKRKLIAAILKSGVKVAMHERGGPANYVKLHPSIDIYISEYLKLSGLRVERDESLVGKFLIGRDQDKFEIEQMF